MYSTAYFKIREEAKAVRGLARKALQDVKGVKPGLKAARDRDKSRANVTSEKLLEDMLPTIEEEMMALKMPSDTDPDMERLDEDELSDYVRPFIHPEAVEYMEAFPDAPISDFFKFLGTGNLLTVQINVDRPHPKTLAILEHLLSALISRKPGWNTSKAPLYLSAWTSGAGLFTNLVYGERFFATLAHLTVFSLQLAQN